MDAKGKCLFCILCPLASVRFGFPGGDGTVAAESSTGLVGRRPSTLKNLVLNP